MVSANTRSFLLFLALVLLTGGVFCLPHQYGWSWGVMIQLWALFGLVRLYHLSEPAQPADVPVKRLSQRLRDSLSLRRQRDSDFMAGRFSRFDSLMLLFCGALLVLWILMASYVGVDDSAALQRSLYTTLYLVAQIFCMGVIAFLAQLYAASSRFVLIGFMVCLAAALLAITLGLARHGLTQPDLLASGWWAAPARGTDIYWLGHEGVSPFTLRHRAMGAGGAILPWLAVLPMVISFLRVLMHPARSKVIPVLGLMLAGLIGFYDLFAVRGAAHFLIVLPAWAALTLAWGRSGYGPLWPSKGRDALQAARVMAHFQ